MLCCLYIHIATVFPLRMKSYNPCTFSREMISAISIKHKHRALKLVTIKLASIKIVSTTNSIDLLILHKTYCCFSNND